MKPDLIDVPGIIRFFKKLLNEHMELTEIERPDGWKPSDMETYLEYYGRTSMDFEAFKAKWNAFEGFHSEPPPSLPVVFEPWFKDKGKAFVTTYTIGDDSHLPVGESLPFISTIAAYTPEFFGSESLVAVYITYADAL